MNCYGERTDGHATSPAGPPRLSVTSVGQHIRARSAQRTHCQTVRSRKRAHSATLTTSNNTPTSLQGIVFFVFSALRGEARPHAPLSIHRPAPQGPSIETAHQADIMPSCKLEVPRGARKPRAAASLSPLSRPLPPPHLCVPRHALRRLRFCTRAPPTQQRACSCRAR